MSVPYSDPWPASAGAVRDWTCPGCGASVTEPTDLPPLSDADGWRAICAEHEQECSWCRSYAPKPIWQERAGPARAA